MPRKCRLDAPGVVHHVIVRGIERRKIFRDNKDRDDMSDRLADPLPATDSFFKTATPVKLFHLFSSKLSDSNIKIKIDITLNGERI